MAALDLAVHAVRAAGEDPSGIGESFKEAMSDLAAGVVMVTCRIDGRPWGVTVTACISVSVSPPTLLVSLGTRSSAARAIAAERSFGVSILGRQQVDVAGYGSTDGAPKFLKPFLDHRDGTEMEASSKTPALTGALAHLDCDVVEQLPVGDHTLFLGGVRGVLLSPGDEPLVYWGRAYRTLAPPVPSVRVELPLVPGERVLTATTT
jgi:flavin reductase (DIM6/NTAB) family NADH-FMN oxidoreductase RutF